MPRRVCTFAVAHTDISAQPFNNAARTVRIFAPNNLSGSAVYVKFSNYYSDGPVWVGNATIGLADAKGRLVPDTVRPLTVHGDTSFALVPVCVLGFLLTYPDFEQIPKILETPYIPSPTKEKKSYAPYKYEIAMLRASQFDKNFPDNIIAENEH